VAWGQRVQDVAAFDINTMPSGASRPGGAGASTHLPTIFSGCARKTVVVPGPNDALQQGRDGPCVVGTAVRGQKTPCCPRLAQGSTPPITSGARDRYTAQRVPQGLY
jgi:hypothetical protein